MFDYTYDSCCHYLTFYHLPLFHLLFRQQKWDFHKSKEEGNTGLYFVRSNKRTIKMWADAFEAVPK